jgi:C1A family cysteine protease
MSKTIAKFALLTIILGSAPAGPAGQTPAGQDDVRLYPKGLIPLTAEETAMIVRTWPQVVKVNVNWLGFERINQVRAEKGEPALDPRLVRPVGREVESAVGERAVSAQSYAAASALALDLPVKVDNSTLKYFPPIRSQNPLGSCASFSTTYTQLSYMTAFQRDLDIRSAGDNTNKYSPKWTYNMINGGDDDGSSFSQVYPLLERHGAATWAEFPYDGNYTAWCLDPAVWRNALYVRSNPAQFARYVSSADGLQYVKELLANGYVLVFGTYITSWQYKTIGDDTSTTDDDTEVGKKIGYWLNGEEGSHAMTIVGYNDALWTDINGNGLIDTGEKGGLRIANSWGAYWEDAGFIWLAYDALKSVSDVSGGPSAGRQQAFQGDRAWLLTARDSYQPLMIAEFTANHAKRNQLKMTLGRSAITATTPTTSWTPAALQYQGGSYAFNGTTTAVDGGFVLDFSDILVEGAGPLRYHLGMNDNFSGDIATLRAFKLVDLTTIPATETVCAAVPQTVDAGQAYAYVDYSYTGPAYDHPPVLTNPGVTPSLGTTADTYTYAVHYYDQDGDMPSTKDVYIDGAAHATSLLEGSASDGKYSYDAGLPVGSHVYYFSFRDSRGSTVRSPLAGTLAGPGVYAFLLSSLSPSSATAGGPAFTLTVNGSDFQNGAVVMWDASALATAYAGAAQLTATVPAANLATGKTVQVTVRNPDGGVSSPLTFTVANPVPALTSLSPSHASAGGSAYTLTATGASFVPGASVMWAGSSRTTTYVNSATLTAAITAADIAAGGESSVTVLNPQPGGGSSPAVLFPVATYTVGAGLTTATVNAGESATYPFEVTPQVASFDNAITFQCTGLPRGTTATFAPTSVTPGAAAAVTSLTLRTTARTGSAAGRTMASPGGCPPLGRAEAARPRPPRRRGRRRSGAPHLLLFDRRGRREQHGHARRDLPGHGPRRLRLADGLDNGGARRPIASY